MPVSRCAALLAASALLISCTPALGQEEEADEHEDLGMDGMEEEGMVDAEPLTSAQLRALFAKWDQDGDGKVSLQEVIAFSRVTEKAFASKEVAPMLELIDTSGDGKVSLEEHLADILMQGGVPENAEDIEEQKKLEAGKHAAADVDGDGLLDGEELPALMYPETRESVLAVTVAATMQQKDNNRDGKLSPREFWDVQEGADVGELSNDADFKKLDKDGDGLLDHDEFRVWESGHFHIQEAMGRLFEIADKDADQHVTADELVAAASDIAFSDVQYNLIEWSDHHEL